MSLELRKNRKAVPGSRRWFSKTLMAAYVVLGLVLWQTIQVVGGGEMPFKRSGKPQIGSTKLHADRDAMSRKNRQTKEPVAAFFERAKRGMTEQEIRGMIADFEALGPMPSLSDLDGWREYAGKQNDWYLTALDEGLSLSSDQKRAVRASLDQDLVHKIDFITKASNGYDRHVAIGALKQMDLSERLYIGNLSPWNVCDLSENQIKLTYKNPLEDKYAARRKQEIENGSHSTSCHTEHILVMHDPVMDAHIDHPLPPLKYLERQLPGSVLGGIIDVTNTFPLTPDQKLADHRNDLLAQAKLLHPAQLRMALLMNPGVAQTLKHELDKPKE